MIISYKNISIFMLLLLTMSFVGCHVDKTTMPIEPDDQYLLDDVYLPDLTEFADELIPGTLTSDIMLKSEQVLYNEKGEAIQCHDNDDDDDGDNDNHNNGCKNGIKYLGKILNHIDLTKEQRKEICDMKHDYKDCLKWAKGEIKKRKKEIIKNANQEKCEIEKKLKKKEISKSSAKQLIKELNERTDSALKELEIAIEIRQCVCTFLSNIISILDENQANDLINYVANEHPEFECDFLIIDLPEEN